jgi:hypothetical protein
LDYSKSEKDARSIKMEAMEISPYMAETKIQQTPQEETAEDTRELDAKVFWLETGMPSPEEFFNLDVMARNEESG